MTNKLTPRQREIKALRRLKLTTEQIALRLQITTAGVRQIEGYTPRGTVGRPPRKALTP